MYNYPTLQLNYQQRLHVAHTADFRKTNYIWNAHHFNSAKNNGYMMDLISECKPVSRAQWERFYLGYRKEHYPDEKFPFENIVNAFATVANISLNAAYTYHYIRVIDKTYDGYVSEQEAMSGIWSYIRKVNPTQVNMFYIKHADKKVDKNMRIDVEVYRLINNQWYEVAGIQLKPQSYFARRCNWSSDAYHQNYRGQVQYVQAVKAPVYYWSYEQVKAGIGPMLFLDRDGNCYAKQYA